VPIGKWWRIRPSGLAPLTGRTQEPSVSADGDGDGVVDFDEGDAAFAGHGVRAFASRADRADSDGDQVNDKQEIRSYTFHALDHPNHPPLVPPQALNYLGPDSDHDQLRAERDPDSDHDGDADGLEDKNGNGRSPQPGETCVFDSSASQSALAAEDSSIVVGAPAYLAGHAFHALVGYTYYVYRGCPLTLGIGSAYQGYERQGTVESDGSGDFAIELTGLGEGCYVVAVDVLGDGRYGDVISTPGFEVVEILDKTAHFEVIATSAVAAAPTRLALTPLRNPSSGALEFTAALPRPGAVRVAIFDAAGRRVRELARGWRPAGLHTMTWDGRDAAGATCGPGVFHLRMSTEFGNVTRKLIRLQ
jgi:hypothetical protein